MSPKQFGFFTKQISCTQLLDCFIHFFANKSINVIYTDIKKAFDSVSQLKLIKTLSQHKINRNLVEWFKEFLQDGTQRVVKHCLTLY